MKKITITIIASFLIVAFMPTKTFALTTTIRWFGFDCVEVAGSNNVIRKANMDECRESEGTSTRWSGSDCLEFTPSGQAIRKANIDECKESDGAVKRRIKPGTAKSVSNADVPKKPDCEELVPDQYVICGGVKYVPDLKNNNGLKRDMKKIQKTLDSQEQFPNVRSISK